MPEFITIFASWNGAQVIIEQTLQTSILGQVTTCYSTVWKINLKWNCLPQYGLNKICDGLENVPLMPSIVLISVHSAPDIARYLNNQPGKNFRLTFGMSMSVVQRLAVNTEPSIPFPFAFCRLDQTDLTGKHNSLLRICPEPCLLVH